MHAFSRLGIAAAVALIVTAAGEAASPPRDRQGPSKPTVELTGNDDLRPIFHFGARDNRTQPGRIRFRCGIDTPLLHDCGRIYQPFSALAFGPHVLRTRALDLAGNASRLTTTAFTVNGHWDAAEDFPLAPHQENPAHDRYGNTTWFYLYDALSHDPTQYQALPEYRQPDANNGAWDLGLHQNGSNTTPIVGVASRDLYFHPDRDYFAVLGWRSPYTGKIAVHVQLRFPDLVLQAPSNGVAWTINRNATQLLGDILTATGQVNATFSLDISVGETIYLVIGNNGDSDYDSTVGSFTVRTLFE